MRRMGFAAVAVVAVLGPLGSATVRAENTTTLAIFWQPPDAPPNADDARQAFAATVAPLHARVVELTGARTPTAPSSLQAPLAAARAAYAKFEFADAIGKLDELQRLADASGGGDLDGRQLSEIFLYRGLARLETGAGEGSWDDLVKAARLDPGRLLDPVRFPPRAVTAYKRAVAEVARAERLSLVLDVPSGAAIRIDGTTAAERTTLPAGTHYVAIDAPGYEPWAAVIAVASRQEHLAPALRPHRAPDVDRLLVLALGENAGRVTAERLIVGALERHSSGWRFVVRDVELASGKTTSEAIALGEVPTRTAVGAVVTRLLAPPVAVPAVAATAPSPSPTSPGPKKLRWWPWVVGGGAGIALVLSVSLGVVYGTRDRASIGGKLPLQ